CPNEVYTGMRRIRQHAQGSGEKAYEELECGYRTRCRDRQERGRLLFRACIRGRRLGCNLAHRILKPTRGYALMPRYKPATTKRHGSHAPCVNPAPRIISSIRGRAGKWATEDGR